MNASSPTNKSSGRSRRRARCCRRRGAREPLQRARILLVHVRRVDLVGPDHVVPEAEAAVGGGDELALRRPRVRSVLLLARTRSERLAALIQARL